jgi:oligopeptide/dipeptide ABC transporter ATP-binding protein
MYLGKVVEMCETEELFSKPLHPYTQALLSAVPVPNPRLKAKRIMLTGDVPSPVNTPPGCVFSTRCGNCMDICRKAAPVYKNVGNEHYVACHLIK